MLKIKDIIITDMHIHAGIIILYNMQRSKWREDRIYAVLGGKHLTGRIFESLILRTLSMNLKD